MIKILHFLRAGIRAITVVLLMAIWILGYLISLIFSKHTQTRAFNLRRSFIRVAMPILGIKVEYEGTPINDPALYISNHRSFPDPMINCLLIDAFVIAKAEVANMPIISKGAELTGAIFVKRENKSSRSATRDKMVEVIKSGLNVLVYPEGTVGTQAQTLPFKKGTFIEAAKHNFPVVPIAMEYQDEIDLWYRNHFVKQMFKQFGKRRTYVKMSIGPAMRSDDGIALSEQAEKWVNEKIKELNRGWSKMFSYDK